MSYEQVTTTPRWAEVRVRDLDTGEILQDIVEANDDEGWYVRYMRLDGELVRDDDKVITECVRGQRIKIEYPPEHIREGSGKCPCGVMASDRFHKDMPFDA